MPRMTYQPEVVEIGSSQGYALFQCGVVKSEPIPIGHAPEAPPAINGVHRDTHAKRQRLDRSLHSPKLAKLASLSSTNSLADSRIASDEARCHFAIMKRTTERAADMQLSFAKRVANARIAAGFATQQALGEALGMHHSSVSNWERGLQWSSPPDLYRMAKILGVTTDWLIAGDDGGLTMDAKRRLERSFKK